MSKWCCTIIHNKDYGYRANMLIDNKYVDDLPCGVDYKTLYNGIKAKTGIEILLRKDMRFEAISDVESIATIDATQYRGYDKDCRVSLKEVAEGWQPCWE